MGRRQSAVAAGPFAADGFDLDKFLPFELSVVATRVSGLLARRAAATFGLSVAEWRVMVVLGRFGTLTAGMAGARAEMDKVKVSRACARLAEAGLVEQTVDPGDGRARLLRLSRRGEEVHRAIIPLARSLEAQLVGGLSGPEQTAVRAGLRLLAARARQLEQAVAAGPPSILSDPGA
jgi:DNA-binding MarR family transcriptional regulator